MLVREKFVGVDKSKAFMSYVQERVDKLDKAIGSIELKVHEENGLFVVQLVVVHRGKSIRVEDRDKNVYKAFCRALDKLKGRMRKSKCEVDKLRRKRSDNKHYIEEDEIE